MKEELTILPPKKVGQNLPLSPLRSLRQRIDSEKPFFSQVFYYGRLVRPRKKERKEDVGSFLRLAVATATGPRSNSFPLSLSLCALQGVTLAA